MAEGPDWKREGRGLGAGDCVPHSPLLMMGYRHDTCPACMQNHRGQEGHSCRPGCVLGPWGNYLRPRVPSVGPCRYTCRLSPFPMSSPGKDPRQSALCSEVMFCVSDRERKAGGGVRGSRGPFHAGQETRRDRGERKSKPGI